MFSPWRPSSVAVLPYSVSERLDGIPRSPRLSCLKTAASAGSTIMMYSVLMTHICTRILQEWWMLLGGVYFGVNQHSARICPDSTDFYSVLSVELHGVVLPFLVLRRGEPG